MKLTFYDAKQQHHPDAPRSGWTVEVHSGDGLLFARFYGSSEYIATIRADAVRKALASNPNFKIEVKP